MLKLVYGVIITEKCRAIFIVFHFGSTVGNLLLLNRCLTKEVVSNLLAVLMVLILIFASKHFIRYMSDAAAGHLPTEFIFKLLSLFTLSYLVLIIPFALFLAILISFGRMYKDSEITAMEACGIGIPSLIRVLLPFILVVATLVAGLSFWVAPWAENTQYLIRDQAGAESEVAFIAPGRFHPIRRGQGVFYIESLDPDSKHMNHVFVYVEIAGQIDIFTAARGYLKKADSGEARYLVLENGTRYEILTQGRGYRFHEFEKGEVQVWQKSNEDPSSRALTKTTSELINSSNPNEIAELHWRIAMPVSSIVLALLAILLSRADPRQGRFAKLFVALICFITYLYLMTMGKTWLKQEAIPAYLGLWWVHVLFISMAFFFWYRQYGFVYLISDIKQWQRE